MARSSAHPSPSRSTRRGRLLVCLLGAVAAGVALAFAGAWSGSEDGTPTTAQSPAPTEGVFHGQYYLPYPGLFPTLNEPEAVKAADAKALAETDEVLGVWLEGHARAYPMSLLAQVHALNDVVGGRPILISGCVVCASAVVADARVDGRRMKFHFEGIHRGTPVLYDEQTRSSWFHLDGRCFRGPMKGKSLEILGNNRYTTWKEWRHAHPDTDVVLPPAELGIDLEDHVTFRGSANVPQMMKPTMGGFDARLPAMDLVYGVEHGGIAMAYPLATLRKAEGMIWTLQGTAPITLWMEPESEAVMAFDPRVDGKVLQFRWDASGPESEAPVLRDTRTQTIWSLDGVGLAGPLQGKQLRAIQGLQAEWYGWSSAHPQSAIFEQP